MGHRSPRPRRIIILACLVLFCTRSFAEGLSAGFFTHNDVTIGATTLSDFRAAYGPASSSKLGGEDEPDVAVCYVHDSKHGAAHVVFEFGPMGSYTHMTGFTLLARRPRRDCVPTDKDVHALATGNGVHLDQSKDEFEESARAPFERRGNVLGYRAVGRRAATAEELKRLRTQWPKERDTYYDVTTTVTARFDADRLIELYVRKMESY